jgi:hypothetical protein
MSAGGFEMSSHDFVMGQDRGLSGVGVAIEN